MLMCQEPEGGQEPSAHQRGLQPARLLAEGQRHSSKAKGAKSFWLGFPRVATKP